MSSQRENYDVALSFAGEDREYVEEVASILKSLGVRVFYDKYEKVSLWGKNLYLHLQDVYAQRARYTVMFISKHYKGKLWTNHERESAQARAFSEKKEYILPARFDDTQIPGILSTVGYIDLNEYTPTQFADLIRQKIGLPTQTENGPPEERCQTKEDLTWPTGTISSAREATQLIREAVFVMNVREWPNNIDNSTWVLEELARRLKQPVLLRKDIAQKLLSDAHSLAGKSDHTGDEFGGIFGGFEEVRRILRPVLTRLPSADVYFAALEYIAPDLRGPLLEKEYYRARDDIVAWQCLLLLKQLGERDTLLKLLKQRLVTIPSEQYRKAYDATMWLAQEFLHDEFSSWWEREIADQDDSDEPA
jgi:hypothetical protein